MNESYYKCRTARNIRERAEQLANAKDAELHRYSVAITFLYIIHNGAQKLVRLNETFQDSVFLLIHMLGVYVSQGFVGVFLELGPSYIIPEINSSVDRFQFFYNPSYPFHEYMEDLR